MLSSLFANTREIVALKTAEDCDAVLVKPLAVLFKHSRSCSLSSSAKAAVLEYRDAHPDAPIFMVFAQQRELSRHVAEATGVPHASPQVIVLRNGDLVGSVSHHGITVESLGELIEN